FAGAEVEWVTQAEQRGTGHAVLVAGPALADFGGPRLALWGAPPRLRAGPLDALLRTHRDLEAAVTVLSTRVPDARGYGRILRTDDGDGIAAIVEERDATPEQKEIDEINSGIYAFDYRALSEVLGGLTAHNAQGEY